MLEMKDWNPVHISTCPQYIPSRKGQNSEMMHMQIAHQNGDAREENGKLTLLHTILLGTLMVRVFSLTRDTLYALFKMVLETDASCGAGAFCAFTC